MVSASSKRKAVVGFILGAIITVSQAELHRYEFNVTSGVVNPDCFKQGFNVPHINGQFPGPIIYVKEGDEVEILVRNQIAQFNTSIHYHGIRQIGSTDSDGVPGITQHPIMPGHSYLQKFKVTQQAGTYFYHAHVGLQDDSVQGSFIVYESDTANPKKVAKNSLLKAGPYEYKKDLVLQLSEWWHEELASRQDYYTSSSFAFDHGSDSILFNGRTIFDPDQKGISAESCQGYTTFDVEPNSTYRLRVIGANSFRTLALAVKNHNMTMIEVDGELVRPYNASFLEVTPGQRFSVLLKTADHPPGTTFVIGTSYLWRQRGRGVTKNGFGYIRYVKPSEVRKENDTYLFKTMKWTTPDKKEKRAEWVGTGDHKYSRYQEGRFSKKNKKYNYEDEEEEDDEDDEEDEEEDEEYDDDHEEEEDDEEHGGKKCSKKQDHGLEHLDQGEHGSSKRENGGKGAAKSGKWAGEGEQDNKQEHDGKGEQGGKWADKAGGKGLGGPPKKPERFYEDLPTFPKMDQPDWLWHQVTPLAARNPIVDHRDVRTIKLHTSYTKLADNTTHYMVNKRIFPMRFAPLVGNNNLYAVRYNYTKNEEQFNEALNTYRLSHNEIVDFVFQNTKNGIGNCLLHPWHTHGHSHYVIASGPGDYIHKTDKDIRNFKNPLLKDTTVAYPSIPTDNTDGCGWTKVRIIADNPGFWAVHCHITTHMIQGKMIVLEEAPELIEKFSLYPRTH